MQDTVFSEIPVQYKRIEGATRKLSFQMASDMLTGSLLKTLAASKKSGNLLELGTGTGLATSWLLQGMDEGAHLTTIDINPIWMEVARQLLPDARIDFILTDGYYWLQSYTGKKFDLIFADAMPGKFELLDIALDLVKPGGFYVVDDLVQQPNWPNGHAERVGDFIIKLEKRKDFTLTRLNCSTGIIVAAKTRETVVR
jgi:predicted O-methyltransferase YrrM